jgi:diguanylate cyclase
VSWISVIENVFRAGGESHLALAVSLAYPVADVVIITIAWASAVVAYRPSMGLLVAGLIIVALSDSVFSGLAAVNDYYTGNLIDLGWLAGCGVLGLAALRSIGEPPREQASALVPRNGQNPARDQFDSLRRRGARARHRGISAPVRRVG